MTSAGPERGTEAWYRSSDDRSKSVYRRANPWYRQIARAVVALLVVGALGVGLYFSALEIQDYLARDKLPAVGADVPDFRSTTFQIRSSAPAPALDGTLILDRTSGRFEFVGRPNGPQAGIHVINPDSSTTYVRDGLAPWRFAQPGDASVAAINQAIPYLIRVDNADTILTARLRQDDIELDERAIEGAGDDELTRYEMTFDTNALADDHPLEWRTFERQAIPSVPEVDELGVTMWLDTEGVVVRLRNDETNWAWERLAYSDDLFRPESPTGQLVDDSTDDSTSESTG